MTKRIISTLLALALVFTMFAPVAKADSSRIITMGADLTKDQEQTVLSFFGITDTSGVDILTINNQMEREVLGGKIPDAQIGTKTYSCAYIEPTTSGGINVRTANLTYVSDATLANALMTAGIQNCNLIVTAPFEVSGTGALTGVYKAYESMGITLDVEKQDAAAEEMIIVSDLEDTYGSEANDIITEVKEIVTDGQDRSQEEIRTIINETAQKHDVVLDDSELDQLAELAYKIQSLDYDLGAFTSTINSAIDAINKNSEGIKGFFNSITSFFKGLFGKKSDSGSGSIFDNVNTDIFKWDK